MSNLYKLIPVLRETLDKNLHNLANEIAANMRSEISRVQGLPQDWIDTLISKITVRCESTDDVVKYVVGILDKEERTLFIAHIANYGMGSAADKQSLNPYLKAYKASKYYNQRRGHRMFIYTRSDAYYDIRSGSWVQGSADSEESTRKLPSWYNNHPAFHWFQNALSLSGIRGKGNDKIKEVIRDSIIEAKLYMR